MAKDCVIESEQLCLKPLEREYLDRYVSWLNDPKLNRHLGSITGTLFTREKGEEWYNRMKEQNDKRIFSLSLSSVSLSFMETNSKARRVPKKLGFQEAGRLRNYWKVHGKYYDRILMDITREEFYAKNEVQMADNYLQIETKIKG